MVSTHVCFPYTFIFFSPLVAVREGVSVPAPKDLGEGVVVGAVGVGGVEVATLEETNGGTVELDVRSGGAIVESYK